MSWVGPYGIKVSENIEEVIAEDGHNILSKDGYITEMYTTKEMNEALYKQLYCEQNAFEEWYYVPGKKQGYWKGPYGVYIPNNIKRVYAADGVNMLTKDGCMTEMFGYVEMNEQIYKRKYTAYIDGAYYYNLT